MKTLIELMTDAAAFLLEERKAAATPAPALPQNPATMEPLPECALCGDELWPGETPCSSYECPQNPPKIN